MLRPYAGLLWFCLPALAGPDPAALQLRVVDGEGAVYAVNSRATHGITVQVSDEAGRPVDGVAVSFQLPETGPGGVFATGARTEIVTTRANGLASVWGMQWNRTVGQFEVRITAAKGQARAGAVCVQHLSDAPSAKSHLSFSHGHKWLWISVAAAGAVVGGAAALRLSRSSGPPPPSAAGALQIGAPTITLGHP